MLKDILGLRISAVASVSYFLFVDILAAGRRRGISIFEFFFRRSHSDLQKKPIAEYLPVRCCARNSGGPIFLFQVKDRNRIVPHALYRLRDPPSLVIPVISPKIRNQKGGCVRSTISHDYIVRLKSEGHCGARATCAHFITGGIRSKLHVFFKLCYI